ncbi:MAG: ribonuclease P protein subunit [Candidatus Aenigmarchaeota archaeon]|nr:ribonuclease P protein subunit [Candidatus Aenigmarchaeota archaeon]
MKNILRQELIGLKCDIIKSKNPCQEKTKGIIVDETLKSIVILSKNKKIRVFKKGTIFRIEKNNIVMNIEGDEIMQRPEDRIKKKFKRW